MYFACTAAIATVTCGALGNGVTRQVRSWAWSFQQDLLEVGVTFESTNPLPESVHEPSSVLLPAALQ